MPAEPPPPPAGPAAGTSESPSAPAVPLHLLLADEAGTAALAVAIASALQPGTTLHLSGNLGSGKTAFTRALLRALGHSGRVRSPTFTLVEPYNLSRFNLYHFDFYRLSSDQAWLDAGFDDYLDGQGVAVIEWPEMAGGSLPPPDLLLRIDDVDADQPDTRRMALYARGPRGQACLNAVRAAGFCATVPGQGPVPR